MHGTDKSSVSAFGPVTNYAGHYRPDIDGLRGIAVLSVVIFHAFPGALRSGFVGVDIFFVISGFLITSIIINGIAKDRFSFATFYARRIKRIFPALAVVLAVSLAAGAFILLPDDYRLLGKHTVAGAAFVSNVALWQEANYFDVAADTKILLHLWSLGIEEQFYLLWPALIWIASRWRLNLLTLFAAVFVASLVYCIMMTPANQVIAFYSPAARFWELAAGSILARVSFAAPRPAAWLENSVATVISSVLFERGSIDKEKLYRDFLSITAIGLIGASVLVITRQHEFPGWWALMPVVGSYFIILAGPGALLNRLLLSNPAMVWIGLISYPLYLWHWPLLAFARHVYGGTPPATIRAGLMMAAVGLAWLTYRYIERPIRFGYRQRSIVPAVAATMAAVAIVGVVDVALGGLPSRLNRNRSLYAAYFESYLNGTGHLEERAQIGQNQCNFYAWDAKMPTLVPRAAIDPDCYTKHSAKSVLLFGDSIAADLYYGLREVLPKDISVLLIFSSGCQPGYLVPHIVQIHHCAMANHFAMERIKADPPDVVVMNSNNSYEIDAIRKVSAMIKGYGVKHVLLLSERPHWKPYLYKIILNEYWPQMPRYIPGHQDEELAALDEKFKAALRSDEPFEFIDERKPFCNSEGCLTFLGNDPRDGMITFDHGHLRPFASVWLARQQLGPLIMERLGADDAQQERATSLTLP
ncbi:acyltransferase family protein [Bradyrhizobium sp. SZCCHNR3015]|uniref:acyltransferase family protein n=2 Tax=Bradyrhizobium TaxID=374 RepID=UPI0029160EDB|nr:acyltransferase family protein [Bradyrhizobium sp. SZCCHNR3015]